MESWVKAKILYPRMPRTNAGFGVRHVSLILGREEGPGFGFYQKVELFFHYKGAANPGRQHPNWFYYWSQIAKATPGVGSPGIVFRVLPPGSGWDWTVRADAQNRTEIRASLSLPQFGKPVARLSGFVGMMGHEGKHETDYYDVIWQKGGYKAAEDNEAGGGDGIRDAWENTRGAWEEKQDPSSDVGGFKDTTKPAGYYFETTPTDFAWSDVRADIAAKQAVDAEPDVDKRDWSNLHVGNKGVRNLFHGAFLGAF